MREFRISEVCNVISGGTPSTKISSYWNGDVVWLTPKDLSNNKSKYIYDSENKITEEGLSRSSTQLLPPNTVLLSSRAPIGYLAIAGKSLCTNQGFKSMVCNQDLIIPEYLYYLLQTKVEDFNNISTGSTFKELSSSLLKQYKISIHDLPEQSHIVDILGSIDNCIENNQLTCDKLEELARQKYLLRISTSTKKIALETIITIFDSQRIPLSSRERFDRKGNFPYYGATGILDYIDSYLFDGEYVLIAEDGTVIDNDGYPIVQIINDKFWVNNHAHILQGTNGYSNALLYVVLKCLNIQKAVTGAVQLKVNQANLCKLEIPNLNSRTVESLNNEIVPLFQKIQDLKQKNAKLNELKQIYLKKFFG